MLRAVWSRVVRFRLDVVVLLVLLAACSRAPTSPPGELHLTSNPGAVEITINGQSFGRTPESGEDGHLIVRLAPGRHTIIASKPGDALREWYGEVEVEMREGQGLPPMVLNLRPRLTSQGEVLQSERAEQLAERERMLAERFALDALGTATDASTGLQWMRCSVGQTWDGQGCAGEVRRFSWTSAQTVPETFEFAGLRDWRVPTQMELHGLTYCSSGRRFAIDAAGGGGGCADRFNQPTIVSAVFPNTPMLNYWSSTPHETYSFAAMGVSFYTGVTGAGGRADLAALRLVRDVR